jgi:hypothetical protein
MEAQALKVGAVIHCERKCCNKNLKRAAAAAAVVVVDV